MTWVAISSVRGTVEKVVKVYTCILKRTLHSNRKLTSLTCKPFYLWWPIGDWMGPFSWTPANKTYYDNFYNDDPIEKIYTCTFLVGYWKTQTKKTVKRLRIRENFSESFKRKLCVFNAKYLLTKLSHCAIFCVFIKGVW